MFYIPYPFKRCTKCHFEYPATRHYFALHKRSRDGLDCWCKSCKVREQRDYVARNPEKTRASARDSYHRHAESAKQRQKRYRQSHIEEIRQKHLEYAQSNREKTRAYYDNYRTRKRNAAGEHTGKDVQRQYNAQKGRCYWCGQKVRRKFHVDHVIPLSRGGSNSPDNIVIACVHCNTSKRQRLPHEWQGGGGKMF